MGLHQTTKFLHSTENHQQNEKTTYWTKRRYSPIIHPVRGDYPKSIKAQKTEHQNTHNPNKQMGREPECRHFSKNDM